MSRKATGAKASCDTLFSKIVRFGKTRCERCGNARPLQCAHIVRRGPSATRCLTTPVLNGWALCAECHYQVDHYDSERQEMVSRTIGQEALAFLETRRRKGVGMKVDWSEERKRLRQELSALLKEAEAA